ncbi:MAG: WbqC family protein [Flavobacteriales bacterium]
MTESNILLSTSYLPPVFYMMCIANSPNVIIEAHEHYQKQSFRNRAVIYDTQGPQNLNIPVKHAPDQTPISAICIDYKHAWQKQHIGALQTAYGQAPYFEYYADEYFYRIKNAPEYLMEFNQMLLEALCADMEILFKPAFTGKFELKPETAIDLRFSIHPKKAIPSVEGLASTSKPHQDRYLKTSAIELLFLHGPESWKYLE